MTRGCVIFEFVRVDALTKALYPPVDDRTVLATATDLMDAMQSIILAVTLNCHPSRLTWVVALVEQVHTDHAVSRHGSR